MKTDYTKKASESLPLFVSLQKRIKEKGAITFRDWMQTALYENPHGYYVREDKTRWGREGDYRTAPETSPLFASTFARYFVKLFQELKTDKPFAIIECGAGNGIFAQGVLSTLQNQFPSVYKQTKYFIDEIRDESQKMISDNLKGFQSSFEFINLNKSDRQFENAIIFSNELIDAFPVHRLVMHDAKLKEIFVDVDDSGNFVLIEKEPSTSLLFDYINKNKISLTENQVIEINLAAVEWIKNVSSMLKNGFVVTVDYGADSQTLYDFNYYPEGTLRAFSKHEFVNDFLNQPGEVDLTTTINWSAFQQTGSENGLQTIRFETLDKFLLNEGLIEQLEIQSNDTNSDAEKFQLRNSIKDLILPNSLGASQQVLILKKVIT